METTQWPDERTSRWCRWTGRDGSGEALALTLAGALGQTPDLALGVRRCLSGGSVAAAVASALEEQRLRALRLLEVDMLGLGVAQLAALISALPDLQEVEVQSLDWRAGGKLPDGMCWRLERPPEEAFAALPDEITSLTLRGVRLTESSCRSLRRRRVQRLRLEGCDLQGAVPPWDADAVEEVALIHSGLALATEAARGGVRVTSLALSGEALCALVNSVGVEILKRVVHLKVSCQGEALKRLHGRGVCLEGLRSLWVSGGEVRVSDLGHVVTSPRLQALALQSVSLLGVRSGEALRQYEALLDLSLCGCDADVTPLIEGAPPSLEALDVSDTRTSQALACVAQRPNLRALWVEGVPSLQSPSRALADSGLRLLDLSYASLAPKVASTLFDTQSMPSIEVLIAKNSLALNDTPSVIPWLEERRLTALETYKLTWSAQQLCRVIEASAATLINLELGNGSNAIGMIDACEAQPLKALRRLVIDQPSDIAHDRVQGDALRRLCGALTRTPIEALTMMHVSVRAFESLLTEPLIAQLRWLALDGDVMSAFQTAFLYDVLVAHGASASLQVSWC